MKHVCKNKIEKRIKEIEAELSGVTTQEIMASHKAAESMRALFKSLADNGTWTEEEKEEMRNLDTNLSNLSREHEMLCVTMNQSLMIAFTKYIVTDEDRLVSPAGYHPDEKVFVQTKLAIHVNDPRDIPAHIDRTVYIHQVDGYLTENMSIK